MDGWSFVQDWLLLHVSLSYAIPKFICVESPVENAGQPNVM